MSACSAGGTPPVRQHGGAGAPGPLVHQQAVLARIEARTTTEFAGLGDSPNQFLRYAQV